MASPDLYYRSQVSDGYRQLQNEAFGHAKREIISAVGGAIVGGGIVAVISPKAEYFAFGVVAGTAANVARSSLVIGHELYTAERMRRKANRAMDPSIDI